MKRKEGEVDSGRNFCPRTVNVSSVHEAAKVLAFENLNSPRQADQNVVKLDNNSDQNHHELEGDIITLLMVRVVQSNYLRYLVVKIDAYPIVFNLFFYLKKTLSASNINKAEALQIH